MISIVRISRQKNHILKEKNMLHKNSFVTNISLKNALKYQKYNFSKNKKE
jgi:hypothetical protein